MSATTITTVTAFEALDSRGNPTVGCVVRTEGGEGVAHVPSGASTGTFEALELRDGGDRYGGKGVRGAVRNVHQAYGPAVIGSDAADQVAVDDALVAADGDRRFGRLGANGALAVSLAAALAAADATGRPLHEHLSTGPPLLPLPMVNVISGGAHAGGAIDMQDLLVVPVGASSFAEAIEWAWRVRQATAVELDRRGHGSSLVADEGGLAARLASNREALEVLEAGLEASGLRVGEDVAVAIDVAANQLWHDGAYRLASEGVVLDAEGLVELLTTWCDVVPIVSIEDPVADHDAHGWEVASMALRGRVQLLGDDLFVTDHERLQAGIDARIANAVLVKPNQTGSLSGARRVVDLARASAYATVLSARSGETEDTWLADVAVAWRTGQIKVGSTTRSERTAKWNRLLRIEAELGGPGRVPFAGRAALAGP